MREISHLLRPGHLQQLRDIFDDLEASENDRFVALDLLKNAKSTEKDTKVLNPVSYTHLRAHATKAHVVWRRVLEK